jgi:hypothetical protein
VYSHTLAITLKKKKKKINLTNVNPLITTTKLHLYDIANQYDDTNSNLNIKIQNKIFEKFRLEINLTSDKDTNTTLKKIKKYCENLIKKFKRDSVTNLLI